MYDPSGGTRRFRHWYHTFLFNGTQVVVLGDLCSSFWPLAYVIPQESILPPMLFNTVIKLLCEKPTWRSGLRCHQCADDTQLYLQNINSITSHGGGRNPEQVLGGGNGKEAGKQTEAQSQGQKSNLVLGNDCTLRVAGFALTPKVSICGLGALLNPGLLLDIHLAAVGRSAFCHFSWCATTTLPRQEGPCCGYPCPESHQDLIYYNALCGTALEGDLEIITSKMLQLTRWLPCWDTSIL